jgi:hypothetical protein
MKMTQRVTRRINKVERALITSTTAMMMRVKYLRTSQRRFLKKPQRRKQKEEMTKTRKKSTNLRR